MAVAAAIILTMNGRAATTSAWQKSSGDHGRHNQWRDASWSLQNRHDSVTAHHAESTANYAETRGQIGDYDRSHVWRYGVGGFDGHSTGITIAELSSESPKARGARAKPTTSVTNA